MIDLLLFLGSFFQQYEKVLHKVVFFKHIVVLTFISKEKKLIMKPAFLVLWLFTTTHNYVALGTHFQYMLSY